MLSLLPPEILFLIIDSVSAERKTMSTFSLVSRSFHSRARIHIFSQAILWVGKEEFCRKRAVDFLRILKYKKNSDLVSRIRSLKILVEPEVRIVYDAELDGYPLGSKGVKKLMGIDTDPIKTALTIFKTAPIEELVLNKSDGEFYDNRTSKLLFEICSNQNLKALSFKRVKNLPYRFIMGSRSAQKLTRLALAQVTISDYDFQVPAPTVASTTAGLETLELVRMPSKDFSKALLYLSHRLPSPISECFKNLTNLVITYSQGVLEQRKDVWNIILGVAGTLESLELRLSTEPPDTGGPSLPFVYKDYDHADNLSAPKSWDIKPLRLDALKSLQQLRIISIDYWRRGCIFRDELTFMQIILASSAFPLPIRSVFLGTSFGAPRDRWQQFTNPSIITPDRWLLIDKVLASPKFSDLRTVEVAVNGFFPCSTVGQGRIDFTALLPAISSNPRILLVTSTTPPPEPYDPYKQYRRRSHRW